MSDQPDYEAVEREAERECAGIVRLKSSLAEANEAIRVLGADSADLDMLHALADAYALGLGPTAARCRPNLTLVPT